MPVAASLIVLAGFAGAVWYAYTWGLEEGSRTELPLVQAQDQPIKVKPDDPGGLKVPNQDALVMNQDGSGEETVRVERLLPEPETPQPPTPREDSTQGGPVGEAQEQAAGDTPAEPSSEGAAESGASAAANTQLAEAPLPSSGQPAIDQSQPGRVTASPGSDPAANSAGTTQTAQTSTTAKEPGQGPGLKKGDNVIQLASVASSEAAQREWARLQKVFPDLLGDMQLAIQKVTVKGKEYHRMQTGPFPNRATAQDMCAQLKAQKQACLVTRR